MLAGLATFEKLSSCVLVWALAAMILGNRGRRNRRHLAAAILGLATGALPLVLVNLGWLAKSGELISLRNLRGRPGPGGLDFARELLALGQRGECRARRGIVGVLQPSDDLALAQKVFASYTILDPACGSGNFLVIAYKVMREIEAELPPADGVAVFNRMYLTVTERIGAILAPSAGGGEIADHPVVPAQAAVPQAVPRSSAARARGDRST